ncbi:hypothetical protein, no similarity [Maudiozyma saulgeensis]|uniref:Uncharacterized protein n=1 Tax=Maudiozyma saulgeensis TaxID=1789683 RepID=A0A1X7QXK3_9SACH|nr:hypothetical protein, no similarity [Kazachstania saulgeensis]
MYCMGNKKRNRHDLQYHSNEVNILNNNEMFQTISLKNQICSDGIKIFINKEVNENLILQEIINQIMNLKEQYIKTKDTNYQVMVGPKGNQIYVEKNIQFENKIISQIIQDLQSNLNTFKLSLLRDNLFNDYQFQINQDKLTIFSERDNLMKTINLFNDNIKLNFKKFPNITNYNIDYKFSTTSKLIAQIIIEIPYHNYDGLSYFNEPEYISCYSKNTQDDLTYRVLEQIRLQYIKKQNITTKRMRCQ